MTHTSPAMTVAAAVRAVEEAVSRLSSLDLAEGDLAGTHELGDWLVRLQRSQRSLQATASTVGHRFRESGEWSSDGALNAQGWIHGRINEGGAEARLLLHRGSMCADFPHMRRAWESGSIGARHIDALWRLQKRYALLRDEIIAADEAITAIASICDPRQFEQRLKALCHRFNAQVAHDIEVQERCSAKLHASRTLDGFVRVDALLDPVLGERFLTALEAARRDLPRHESSPDDSGPRDIRSISERNVEAPGRILDAAHAATGDLALPTVCGERATINVTVPLDTILAGRDATDVEVAWLERFGAPMTVLSGESARTLACDASVRPLVVDRSGQLVALMPKVRAIHPALRRAVLLRDVACRFPGCRQRIDEVHHIVFHSHGGPTTMANLVGLCWHHHRTIHDRGWVIEGDPGGRLDFMSPQGRGWTSFAPASAGPPGSP